MPHRYIVAGVPISVIVLIAVTSMIELAIVASDYGLVGDASWRAKAYAYGAVWAPLLHGAQPLFPGQQVSMFATYAFLHGGLVHLIVNMIALFSLGTIIVSRVGQKRFLVAYALCALGGSACFGLFSNSGMPMVGASGALFGLIGIWICWDYLDRRYYGDPLWVTMRALVFLVVYNLVFWVLLSGRLAWETHLGGFIAGWLLAVYWGRPVLTHSRKRRFGPVADRSGRPLPGRSEGPNR